MILPILLFFIVNSLAIELNNASTRTEKAIEVPKSFYIIGQTTGQDSMVANSKFFRPGVKNEVITFTETFHADKFLNTITQVTAMELSPPWTGTAVQWIGGGPGYNYVTLKFISQPGQSINLLIMILAKSGKPFTNY